MIVNGTTSTSADPAVVALKQASGRGRLFDEGALAVVAEIEVTGRYRIDRTAAVLLLLRAHERGEIKVLTAAEVEAAGRFLAARGWTADEGSLWAAGVTHAQNLLYRFSAGR